jgi:hypothetical protein
MTQHSHPNAPTKFADTANFAARDESVRCLSYGVLRKLAGLPQDTRLSNTRRGGSASSAASRCPNWPVPPSIFQSGDQPSSDAGWYRSDAEWHRRFCAMLGD